LESLLSHGMPDVLAHRAAPLKIREARLGLDVVAENGLSTKTVKPSCSTAALETDGSTTCV